MKDKIIVALDGMTRTEALELADKLRGAVWGFKVNDLLVQCGAEIVGELKKRGNVFADPKLNDIPNTVGNSVKVLSEAGADLITVHTSASAASLRAAIAAAGSSKILAITVLTSMSDDDSRSLFGAAAAPSVERFAGLAASAGVHGIVCSPKELPLVAQHRGLIKVTPGVRPSWYGKADDQTRTMTPKEAVEHGASFLVVGRPITGHKNPAEAVRLIVEELA